MFVYQIVEKTGRGKRELGEVGAQYTFLICDVIFMLSSLYLF